MRRLVVLAGIALSCAALPPPAAPSREKRIVDWCERAYPWPDGPLIGVQLRECSATYQETVRDPPETGVWTWRLEQVRYEADGEIAVVTLEMRESIGGRSATFSRTYRYRCGKDAVLLVRADDVVLVRKNDGEFAAPR